MLVFPNGDKKLLFEEFALENLIMQCAPHGMCISTNEG